MTWILCVENVIHHESENGTYYSTWHEELTREIAFAYDSYIELGEMLYDGMGDDVTAFYIRELRLDEVLGETYAIPMSQSHDCGFPSYRYDWAWQRHPIYTCRRCFKQTRTIDPVYHECEQCTVDPQPVLGVPNYEDDCKMESIGYWRYGVKATV